MIPNPAGPGFELHFRLAILALMQVLLVGLIWIGYRHNEATKALTVPLNPAIDSLASMDTLLRYEQYLAPLRGKVRELRTYSAPSCGENGFIPRYYSVLIDSNGEIHELEHKKRLGILEERAVMLAQRLAVPFYSGI